MDIKGISLRDLAIYISDYLRVNEIETVLSGGACVTIYTDNKYQSYDLDFVLRDYIKRQQIKRVLEKIGFFEKGRSFKHKDTQYFIEFLPPPLSVGEEPVNSIFSIEEGNRTLRLLSPTDCVKDRLAAYYHWNDQQSFEQAVMVCRDNEVDLKEIERWSLNEGMKEKFEILERELTAR
jgi:hypothetical protein